MADTHGLSVGGGDAGHRLASWGWHLPLRIRRWGDVGADSDPGQPHRDGNRAGGTHGDGHVSAGANPQSDTDTDALVLGTGDATGGHALQPTVTHANRRANGRGDGRAVDLPNRDGGNGAGGDEPAVELHMGVMP